VANLEEKIEKLKEEIKKTPYHKGTEHYVGKLRAQIAKLEDELFEKQTKNKSGQHFGGFAVKKQGDGTVALIGFPSVGKSTLLNRLTSANSRVGQFAFTTLTVIPGMMEYKGAKIQILDLPGLVGGAAKGKGRGSEVLSVARMTDLLVLICEADKENQLKTIEDELYNVGIRINQEPPKVFIKKKLKGGIKSNSKLAVTIAKEFKIVNAEIQVLEDLSLEQLVDAFSQNRVYLPSLFVVNKIDQSPKLRKTSGYLYISSLTGEGLENLKEAIWKNLRLIRVYLKPPGKEPVFSQPLILKEGQTVREAIEKISSDLSVKEAKVWGKGVRFPGQTVSLNHQLFDENILTLSK